ncbi:MAG: hypothetical protein JWM59_2803 [Verrucomicrobiales bacterium]|nr:hypothetical protein [Verrucomicrobiales bacterium]
MNYPTEATARWLQGTARFSTTRWSLVLEAGTDGDEREGAMNEFCRIYWYPVYAFIRRRGADPEPARDLTQGFFEKLLTRDWLAGLERKETRFSTLLCVTLKNFLASEYRRDTALKRGGGRKTLSLDMAQAEHWFGAEPVTDETPERLFERRWAQAVMEAAMRRLEDECVAMGKGTLYSVLHSFLAREPEEGEYERSGTMLGVDRRAVAVAVFRLRKQFKSMVREEVAGGLRDPSMLDEEMRHLAAAL